MTSVTPLSTTRLMNLLLNMALDSKDPEVLFSEIYTKAKELGLSAQRLENLPSMKLLKGEESHFHQRRCYWISLLLVMISVVYYYGLHTTEGFSRVWFYWENIDINEERCTIEMPVIVQNAFMPPVDCSYCEDLSEVERIASITPKEFEETYAYSGIPVIVTDATTNWTAPKVFSYDFFWAIYREDSPALSNYGVNCQFFPYDTDFQNLSEVFKMSYDRALMLDGNKPWYIGWANCDPTVANILRRHYQRPYFIPEYSEISKIDWIFMGSPGYGANLHIDQVNNPSWQAQIKGRKLWKLEPVPECYKTCTDLEFVIEPGEIIVLDTNLWYHKTIVVDEEISIAIGAEFD